MSFLKQVTGHAANKKRALEYISGSTNGLQKNKKGNFAQDQTEKPTTGWTNCFVGAKGSNNHLTLNQKGPWKPNPWDYRNLLMKVVNPRLSLNYNAKEVNVVITAAKPTPLDVTYLQCADMTAYKRALAEAQRVVSGTGGVAPVGSLAPSAASQYLNNSTGAAMSLQGLDIVQWQSKAIVKNISTHSVMVQIFDFVSNRDCKQGNNAYTIWQDYILDGKMSSEALGKVALYVPQIGTAYNHDYQTDTQQMTGQAEAKRRQAVFWKLLKKTKIRLEPGGIFEYVQSMYDIKLSNYLLQHLVQNTTDNIKGMTRELYMSFEGQLVSGPAPGGSGGLNNTISPGSAECIVSSFENVTLQNSFYQHPNRCIGVAAGRDGYWNNITNAYQNVPNDSGEVPISYDSNL